MERPIGLNADQVRRLKDMLAAWESGRINALAGQPPGKQNRDSADTYLALALSQINAATNTVAGSGQVQLYTLDASDSFLAGVPSYTVYNPYPNVIPVGSWVELERERVGGNLITVSAGPKGSSKCIGFFDSISCSGGAIVAHTSYYSFSPVAVGGPFPCSDCTTSCTGTTGGCCSGSIPTFWHLYQSPWTGVCAGSSDVNANLDLVSGCYWSGTVAQLTANLTVASGQATLNVTDVSSGGHATFSGPIVDCCHELTLPLTNSATCSVGTPSYVSLYSSCTTSTATSCCSGQTIPSTLHMTVATSGSCSCVSGSGLAMSFNGNSWDYTWPGTVCGVTPVIADLWCQKQPAPWVLQFGSDVMSSSSVQCTPSLVVTFPTFVPSFCGLGHIQVTVTA